MIQIVIDAELLPMQPFAGFRSVPMIALAAALLSPLPAAAGEGTRIGAVSTTFRFIGRNDKIVVDRYDDPRVSGVSCYMSHAETGGVKGSFGLATDPSRFSVACRATGKVVVQGRLPASETVFDEKTSFLLKVLRVTRLYDADKHVLVYLAWSTKSLSTGGSPYNSITAVPLDAASP